MPEKRRMAGTFMIIGAALGLLGVAAGAFGAHGLQKYFADHEGFGAIFETACRYQMYHALALLAVGLAAGQAPSRALEWAGWLMFAGVLVFSGSLYALVLTGIRSFGAVTPIGGTALLAGWALFIVALVRAAAR
jgi:uncharacterized membrane protein YgdD (TMEM256/DUF423 family)